MDDNLEQLRDGLALLVVDIPKPRLRDEDGSPMVFAYDEDALYASMEWATMNRVRVTQDPLEDYDSILVALTPEWRKSKEVTGEILRAQRRRIPIFFLNPESGSARRYS